MINITLLRNKLKKTKSFIFDLDGTLVDLEKLNYFGYASTVKKHFKHHLTDEEYQRFFSGTRTADGLNYFMKNHNLEYKDVQNLILFFRSIKRNQLKTNPEKVVFIKKNVKQLLELLKKKKLSTLLATSTTKEFSSIVLNFLNIDSYFNLRITAEDVSKGKPDPQIYLLALKKLGNNKDEAVVFEDSLNGIKAAKNAGIFCIGILNKGLNDKFINQADIVIEDFQTVIDQLNRD